MPIYEFQCEKCGKRVQRLYQSADGAPLARGCECGDIQYRTLSSCSFRINGYNEANGYAKKGSNE